MCRELRSIRQSIATYAGQFDARCLSGDQAAEAVRVCAQIEASAASIKALAAARAAEGRDWQLEGYRSAADQLAHDAGMSPSNAKRALEAGRRMAEQPEVAAAALAGELSLEQAAAISDGVAANPTKARDLIDKARRSSLHELNDEVSKVKAAKTDQEQRRRAIHAKRSFRRWTDRDGAFQAHLYGHPEDGAGLWRMLDPIRRRLNALRRESGAPNDSFEGLDYDAMMAIASIAAGKDGELGLADLLDLGLFPQIETSTLDGRQHPALDRSGADQPGLLSSLAGPDDPPAESVAPTSPTKPRRKKKLAGSPIRIMVRVDFDALLRGVPLEGELCEIAGYGPVPVSVVEDLLATENPFIIGILTKGQALTGVYHHGRHPNAYQRSALDFLYPTCAVERCSSREGLQYDHREDFAKTKITAFDLLDRYCGYHHGKKTRDGWALVDGRGKRAFVPPDDPRHPRFHDPPADSAI
jgi:hypothetical protein